MNINKYWLVKKNKNYYVVRNARFARSRYTLTLSLIFLINELINRVYLEWLTRR